MQLESSTVEPSPASSGTSWRTRVPFFYGWVVVASVFVVMAVVYGMFYSFSVYMIALIEEFGWSRATVAGAMSVCAIAHAFSGVGAGALIDRFGPSKVVPAGGVLLAAGLFATSQINQVWQFYLYWGLICGVAFATVGWVPGVIVVSRWFSAKQGIAMGIASAGIGLGIVVAAPVSQYLISTVGWRSAYQLFGLAVIIGAVPQAALLLKGRPEELGLRPDGVQSEPAVEAAPVDHGRQVEVVDSHWASTIWTVGRALRTHRFWLLTAGMFLALVTNQLLWAHQAPYLVDAGFDKMLAASMVGLVGFVSIIGKILWGEVGDRLGRERAFTVGIGVVLLSLLLLVGIRFAPFVWLVILSTVVISLGYAVTPPVISTASSDLFAGPSFGAIYGLVCVGQGLGSALGSWLGGYVFDTTGSYMLAFALGALCSITAAVCLWLAAPRRVRRVVFK